MYRRILAGAMSLALLLTACPEPPAEEDSGGELDSWTEPDAEGEVDTPSYPPDPGGIDVPPIGCTSDEQCLAELDLELPVCATLYCVDGECTLGAAPDGTACTTFCSDSAGCLDGLCVDPGGVCDDLNPCTTDQCAPEDGCVHTFNQRPCDDGSACTADDHCFMGECQGVTIECDDNNPCTDDSCDPASGCLSQNNTLSCEDGDACTAPDVCADGACVSGGAVDCDDNEVCTEEYCDTVEGCVTTVLQGECDDGNACTENDWCKDAQCLGDTVWCDDGNVCTTDYCDTALGCQFTANAASCQDGDPCTLFDYCQDEVCQPGAPDPNCCELDEECDDGDLCTDDTCVNDYCSYVAKDCDDDFVCTADSCVAGQCVHDPYGSVPSGPILTEDWESGLLGWSLDSTNGEVYWQLDTSKKHWGAKSLYCGNIPAYHYDFGATRASFSRMINLPPTDSVTLSFWIYQDVEEISCTFDVTRVYVQGTELDAFCEDVTPWTLKTYELAAWAGMGEVELKIEFDTLDSIANMGPGVWIDDLSIETAALGDCCLEDTDCAGGVGCQAEVCLSDAFVCGVEAAAVACDDQLPCTIDTCEVDGQCTNTPDPTCCVEDGECPADPIKVCAVPVCVDNTCGFDMSGCCLSAEDCPDPPEGPCATKSCSVGGLCEYDTSLCCSVAGDCPEAPEGPCAVASCSVDGSCEYDTSLCCSVVGDCPEAPEGPCAVASCSVDGTCEYDTSLCCSVAGDCPEAPEGPCAVASCSVDGSCEYDTSLCCSVAGDCPAAAEGVCAVVSCSVDGVCEYDTSLCCSVAGDCPEHPKGPCGVPSCSAEGECQYDTATCPPTWTFEIGAFVQSNCAPCHTGGSTSGGLDLSAWSADFATAASVQCAGLTKAEAIATKVADDWGTSCAGSRMPAGGPYLTVEEQQLLADWVAAGAPE